MDREQIRRSEAKRFGIDFNFKPMGIFGVGRGGDLLFGGDLQTEYQQFINSSI
jgi:hypothetical protein